MNRIVNIRPFYAPVQPASLQPSDGIMYRECLPDTRLQHLIYCYWQLKTTRMLAEQFSYRVVADGCIDIFFEPEQPGDSHVMGFSKTFTAFQLGRSFHYVGVRFLPTMFSQLYRVPAGALSNRLERLDEVIPRTSGFIKSHICPGEDMDAIKGKLDRHFLQLAANAEFNNDGRLYEALQRILGNTGGLNVERDLDTGISPRQLRRLFDFYIGGTPKAFCEIVQFQQILKVNPSRRSLRKSKLFFDAGYYDQAHFIKAFKNFYGLTPGQAFDR